MRTIDIVVVSRWPWEERSRRDHRLLSALMRERTDVRALFVNPMLHRWPRRPSPSYDTRRLVPVPEPPGAGAPRLWRLQITTVLPARFYRLAETRFAAHVQQVTSEVGFPRPVLWISDPRGANLLAVTGWPTVYDASFDWSSAVASGERMLANEDFLLREAQEVVTSSASVALEGRTDRRITVIPDGNAARRGASDAASRTAPTAWSQAAHQMGAVLQRVALAEPAP